MTDTAEGLGAPVGAREGPRIVAAVQARTASSRFPGKVLAPILGEPMVLRIAERLKYVRALDDVVVATTVDETDDELVRLCEEHGVGTYRGQVGELGDGKNDIAKRLLNAASAADVVVRVWGDCPCVGPEHVAEGLGRFFAEGLDHMATFDAAHRHSLPYGTGFEIYAASALASVLGSPFPRDHLYPFEYVRSTGLRSGVYASRLAFSNRLSLAVDYPEDIARTEAIYRRLYSPTRAFTVGEVLVLPDYVLEPGQGRERNTEYMEAMGT